MSQDALHSANHRVGGSEKLRLMGNVVMDTWPLNGQIKGKLQETRRVIPDPGPLKTRTDINLGPIRWSCDLEYKCK